MQSPGHRQNGVTSSKVGATQVIKPIRAALNRQEVAEFKACEHTIEKHLGAFLEVGRALMEIQAKRLYRAQYRSFDDYCRDRWSMGRFYAYRQIQAAEVVSHLLTDSQQSVPKSEWQVRPLVGLDQSQIQETWERAVKKAAGGKVTATLVEAAKNEVTGATRSATKVQDECWSRGISKLVAPLKKALKQGNRAMVTGIVAQMSLLAQVGADVSHEPDLECPS